MFFGSMFVMFVLISITLPVNLEFFPFLIAIIRSYSFTKDSPFFVYHCACARLMDARNASKL